MQFSGRLQLTKGKNVHALDTLAAAQAENGDFKLAREWAVKALELARREKDRAEIESRLKLYELNKPFRDQLK